MSIKFSSVEMTDGKMVITEVRTLDQSSIAKCPHFIMVTEHYRDDETCRCNDEDHTVMADWGYSWNGLGWS